ncbi:MAG: response regulator [Proteobacteria bacterium]|nr:response regulator [Pseudomonadota bacterium]
MAGKAGQQKESISESLSISGSVVRAGHAKHSSDEIEQDPKNEPHELETMLQETKQHLIETHKLVEIGRLAAGVAHDMNNVLASIMGLATLLREETKPDDSRMEDIQKILSVARRGSELTRNLLGFARKNNYHNEQISLNKLAIQIKQILTRLVSKRIVIETRLESRLAKIEGNSGQISQVLMNLCVNAKDALEGEGTLVISTENISTGEKQADSIQDLKPGRYVKLQVIDDGVGMSADTLERVYEPFFTTKEPDQGTGLGLSIVHNTIQNMGGKAVIESRPGVGTSATVFLPAIESFVPEQTEVETVSNRMNCGKGTLLLVDDERLIRDSVQRLLNRLGYAVIAAESGPAALEVFEIRRDNIDLVILDMDMPIMDGAECFFRLQDIDPKVKVLISSGMVHQAEIEELLTIGALDFLQKPFEFEQLSQVVAKAMTGSIDENTHC